MKNLKNSKKAILEPQWTVTLHPLAERELQTIPVDMQAVGNAHDWPRWDSPCRLRCRSGAHFAGAACVYKKDADHTTKRY